jgi:hypothetical protein
MKAVTDTSGVARPDIAERSKDARYARAADP